MRQVPRLQSKNLYGVVGDGQAARHFSHYLQLLGIPFKTWSRTEASEYCENLADRLSECKIILVLISDSAIETFLKENERFFKDRTAVHFSGSLVTPLAEGFHPLMSFGGNFLSLDEYKKIPFILERGRASFEEIFPDLSNPHITIHAKDKSLYHSFCVMSGNFTTLLWQKVFKEMQSQLQIPREYLHPYLEAITRNLLESPESALSGPIHRRDVKTLTVNLKALRRDPYAKIYRAFVETHVPDAL